MDSVLGIPWAWRRTGTGLFLELGFTLSQVQSSRGGDYLGRKWGSGLQLASALYHQGGRWSQDKQCTMLQPNVIIWLRVITWTTDINNHTDDERKWLNVSWTLILECILARKKRTLSLTIKQVQYKTKTKWRNLSACVVGLAKAANTNTIQMYALNIKHTI